MKVTWEKAEPIISIVPSIRSLHMSFDVAEAVAELDAHPELWDEHTVRTERYNTPHTGVSDIWVRFNDWKHFKGDATAFTQLPHESVWYPCAAILPAVKRLVFQVFRYVIGEELGGVLITKIPPGGSVLPHVDTGWHAEYYDKFAVQLKGNKEQAFCFADCELRPMPGELYTFDNSKLHFVTNCSTEDRMTLIVCIRR
jgi:hypothetical protein